MTQTPRLASSAENEAAALVFGTGPRFAPAKMATRTCVNDGLNGLVSVLAHTTEPCRGLPG
jgi:hypothetical protein